MSQTPPTVDPVLKRIKLIRFWTFGVFVLAFVVETLWPGLIIRNMPGISTPQILGALVQYMWWIWLITFVVCGLVFFGYPVLARRGK